LEFQSINAKIRFSLPSTDFALQREHHPNYVQELIKITNRSIYKFARLIAICVHLDFICKFSQWLHFNLHRPKIRLIYWRTKHQ